ncbi:MAG: M14 family metallopeptidase [Gemmatimonadaceae bacterium]
MTTRSIAPLLAAASLALLGTASAAAQIPTPREHLGFEVGADRQLADWQQIVGYFAKLAAASPEVELDTLGPSTQGRPLILATITSAENIRKIDAIRAAQRRLADPRSLSAAEERTLVASQPAVVVIQCNIHSTEIASAQMAMELAHRLVTNDTLRRALDDVVVLLLPSANPDGEQMVVEWYRRNLGTRWEGGPLPWLYHPYVGHDNNRDWYMVTQRETKLITDLLYRQWFPEVFYDVHQMGSQGMRLFVPPFVDPINPNVDPLIVRAIAHIGAEMALALEERGKTGVGDQAVYDLWWHGGARSTPTRHNMVGVLTEAASVRIATPITQDTAQLRGHSRGLPQYERRMNFPNPWPGGAWRLRDIVEYELIAAEALVRMLAQQRGQYVANFAALGRKQVALGKSGSPRGYVIPLAQRDPSAVRRLVRVLTDGGVEVDSADDVTADGARLGRSYVVRLDQPYRPHVLDLLEPQRFPRLERWPGGPIERPYDVAGWTLPLQMGVSVVRADSLRYLVPRAGMVATVGVDQCGPAVRLSRPLIYVTNTVCYREIVRSVRRERAVEVSGSGGTYRVDRMPRIGLYKPWTANMDEGWTRWVLEEFDMPYTSLTDSAVRAGGLRDRMDAILVTDMSLRDLRQGMSDSVVPPAYAGGLGGEGIERLKTFVNAGGTLVLLDRASELATADLGVGVQLVRVPPRPDDWEPAAHDTADAASELYAPGSILRVLVDAAHPIGFGMPDTAGVFFTNSMTFDVPSGSPVQVIARYPTRENDILMSGFLSGAAAIAGKAAAIEAPVGRGRVVMFGFRPQYRGQSYGTFRMLFNALLYGGNAPGRR